MNTGYMKNSYLWIMSAAAIALSSATPARADDPALSFALAPPDQGTPSEVVPTAVVPTEITASPKDAETLAFSENNSENNAAGIVPSAQPDKRLSIPATASAPPVQPESWAKAELPPPPPLPETPALPEPDAVVTIAPNQPANQPVAAPDLIVHPQISQSNGAAPTSAAALSVGGDVPPPVADTAAASSTETRPVELSFALTEIKNALGTALGNALSQLPGAGAASQASLEASATDPIFEGGAESLVARTVGSAEGTRTAEGLRTPAYYGHKDPGNGVWNLGSFSYQHGANSPEAADEKQLARLQSQAATLQQKAVSKGLSLTLEEHLNGIDLANQAPMAALDRGGYIDWLAEAKQLGMTGEEAVLWARTRSFLNPDTQQWNAPGLGNNINSISHDQERRMRAIARALNAYQEQKPGTPPAEPLATLPASPSPTPSGPAPEPAALAPVAHEPVAPEPAAPPPVAPAPIAQPSPDPTAIAPVPVGLSALPEPEAAEQPVSAAESTPSFLAWFMP